MLLIPSQVNNNGDISFDTPVGTFTPDPFPLAGSLQLIAPYWSDVDTRNGGQVWFREASSDAALLMRARNEIRMAFISQMMFEPTFLFIATWDHVSFFGGAGNNLVRKITGHCIVISVKLFLYL